MMCFGVRHASSNIHMVASDSQSDREDYSTIQFYKNLLKKSLQGMVKRPYTREGLTLPLFPGQVSVNVYIARHFEA